MKKIVNVISDPIEDIKNIIDDLEYGRPYKGKVYQIACEIREELESYANNNNIEYSDIDVNKYIDMTVTKKFYRSVHIPIYDNSKFFEIIKKCIKKNK
ncbi:MAG: hypothetical protein ABIL58_00695 [Pseudomonadota bacterium]